MTEIYLFFIKHYFLILNLQKTQKIIFSFQPGLSIVFFNYENFRTILREGEIKILVK